MIFSKIWLACSTAACISRLKSFYAAIGCLIIFVSPVNGQQISDSFQTCAILTNDAERLHCYDQLVSNLNEKKQGQVDAVNPTASKNQTLINSIDSAGDELPEIGELDNNLKKGRWLGIESYRRNYILPFSYNDRVNPNLINGTGGAFQADDIEVKFQLSFQLPIWENILGQELDLYLAYTQLSFFQAYNEEYSEPFRETNYEPEIGLNWQPDLDFMGWKVESVRLALNHQSNGRVEPLSRSWDRIIGQFKLKKDDFGIGLRVWKRIEESAATDDNPDIIDYLGYGELFAGLDIDRHHLGFLIRNPLENETLQLDWSYLLNDKVRLYMQYFNGYGESLLDYNHRVDRIGVGFMLNEWP